MNKTFNDYDNQVKAGDSQLYEKLGLKVKGGAKNPCAQSTSLEHLKNDEGTRNFDGPSMMRKTSKGDIKKDGMTKMNKWSYYDSNMNNSLIEQRKVVR